VPVAPAVPLAGAPGAEVPYAVTGQTPVLGPVQPPLAAPDAPAAPLAPVDQPAASLVAAPSPGAPA
jgi:hypothetical protein